MILQRAPTSILFKSPSSIFKSLHVAAAQRNLFLPAIHRNHSGPQFWKSTYDMKWNVPLKRHYNTSTPSNPSDKRENIYTIPNALTVSRILMSPVIGYCIVTSSFSIAFKILLVAGFTDALDGWIARRFKMSTAIGSVLDPAADKILMTCLVVSLTHAQSLPLALGALIIGRDVLLALRTAFYRYRTLPEPKTWSRYWDLSLVTAEVKPPFISKLNTVLQLALMASSLAISAGFGSPTTLPLLEILQYSVATTTIWSGLYYFTNSNTMKLRV